MENRNEAVGIAISLELLTKENLPQIKKIDRSDIPESWVDTADTLFALTSYGLDHNCMGHTYAIRYENTYIGVILLGEAIPWETDPEEMNREPFYRLMGFVIDKRYRGKGIGGIVLETAIQEIYQEFGVRPIALGIHEENKSAVAFYERHGFRATNAMEGTDRYYLRYPERKSK